MTESCDHDCQHWCHDKHGPDCCCHECEEHCGYCLRLEEAKELLRGTYTDQGVERWLDRARVWLNGSTPRQILATNDGDDEYVRFIFEHLEWLKGMFAT